jgi:MFS family permease
MGFTAVEYGVGSGLYFLGYGLFILPSTFITIKHGARRWVGAMTVVTGVLGVCHALIRNKPGFYILRCLLGVAEAGGGSSAGHLLAQFYPKNRCTGVECGGGGGVATRVACLVRRLRGEAEAGGGSSAGHFLAQLLPKDR